MKFTLPKKIVWFCSVPQTFSWYMKFLYLHNYTNQLSVGNNLDVPITSIPGMNHILRYRDLQRLPNAFTYNPTNHSSTSSDIQHFEELEELIFLKSDLNVQSYTPSDHSRTYEQHIHIHRHDNTDLFKQFMGRR
ncbi:hypothetical protein ACSBR1_011433 [Camellia fascicularis]